MEDTFAASAESISWWYVAVVQVKTVKLAVDETSYVATVRAEDSVIALSNVGAAIIKLL